jgi:putative endonuclease
MASHRKQPCVYILASGRNGTLYAGVTSHLVKRVWEHKNKFVPGFAERYSAHALVWFEMHATMDAAITREKTIKNWKRKWKLQMIEQTNPYWRDLYEDIA